MEFKTNPELILMTMFPSVSLQQKATLNKLLDALQINSELMPAEWGNNEQVHISYDQKEILEKVSSGKEEFEEIYLYRKKSIKYIGSIDTQLSSRASLNFKFDKSTLKKYWETIFDLSDRIAEIVKPRYGTTNILWSTPIPWSNERERLQRWMYSCMQPTPAKFFPNGPLGVGMRTYLSGDILDLIGEDVFYNTEVVIKKQAWGGICIDLIDKPWQADIDNLLDIWLNVMKCLERTKVLAIPSFKGDKAVFYTPNEGWKNRGKD